MTLPPICYFGGKTLSAQWLISQMPPHRHYVEPYAGSLAVLLAKAPVPMETVNDLDGEIVAWWRVLRDRPADLERVCALTPHARAEHADSYSPVPDDHPDPDLERARRVWVQLTQGRAGIRTKTGWRHYQDPAGPTSMPRYLKGYVGRIAPAAERLARVSLECRPAIDVIRDYGKHPDVLLYVDPPYLGTTRNSGGYLHDMPDTADHAELLEALLACRASVVLSGYASDLYQDALAGWSRRVKDVGTGQSGEWGRRTEVAWCNREPEDALFELTPGGAA